MFSNLFLNDFERSDPQSGSWNAVLLEAELNAFEGGKLCFRSRRAMLLRLESSALKLVEQCSRPYGAVL